MFAEKRNWLPFPFYMFHAVGTVIFCQTVNEKLGKACFHSIWKEQKLSHSKLPHASLKGKWQLLGNRYQMIVPLSKNNPWKFGVPISPQYRAGAPVSCQFSERGTPYACEKRRGFGGRMHVLQRGTPCKTADWLPASWRHQLSRQTNDTPAGSHDHGKNVWYM